MIDFKQFLIVYLSKINTKFKQNAIIFYVSCLLETLIALLVIFIGDLSTQETTKNYSETIKLCIAYNEPTIFHIILIFLFGLIMTGLFIAFTITFYRPNKNTVKDKQLNNLSSILCISMSLTNVLLIPIVFSIYNIIMGKQTTVLGYVSLPFGLLFILFTSTYLIRKNVVGIAVFFMPVMLLYFNSLAFWVVVTLWIIVRLVQLKTFFKNLLRLIIVIACINQILQQIYPQESTYIFKIYFLCLVLGSGIVFILRKDKITDRIRENQYLIKVLQKYFQNSSITKNFQDDQYKKIQYILSQQLHNMKQSEIFDPEQQLLYLTGQTKQKTALLKQIYAKMEQDSKINLKSKMQFIEFNLLILKNKAFEINRYSNIFKILEFYSETIKSFKPNKIQEEICIYEMRKKFLEIYMIKSQRDRQHIFIENIIDISQKSRKFYLNCETIFELCTIYWNLFLSQKINEKKMQKVYIQLKKKIKEIKSLLISMTKQYSLQRQAAIFSVLQSFFSRSTESDEKLNESVNKRQNINSKKKKISNNTNAIQKNTIDITNNTFIKSVNYFMCMNNQIKKISFAFTNQFNYHNHEVVGEPIDLILFPFFIPIIEQFKFKSSNPSLPIIHQAFPLATNQGYLKLRDFWSFLYPDIDQGIYFLHYLNQIPSVIDQQSILVLLQLNSESVIGVSKAFMNTLKIQYSDLISQEAFGTKSTGVNEKLNVNFQFSKYFQGLDLTKQIVISNLMGNYVSCTFKYHHQTTNLLAQIIKEYKTGQKSIVILELVIGSQTAPKSGFVDKQKQNLDCEISNKMIYTGNQENLAEKYANEKFFCPISNYYSIKIQEKQERLKEKCRLNYFCLMISISVVIFCILVTIGVLNYVFTNDLTTTGATYSSQISQQFIAYQQMLKAYYYSFMIYHVTTIDKTTSLDQLGMNKTEITSYLKQQLNKNTKLFMKQYLSLQRENITSLNSLDNLTIAFEFFDVKFGKKTGLTDFAMMIKKSQRGVEKRPITFLLKNLQAFLSSKIYFTIFDLIEYKPQSFWSNPITIVCLISIGLFLLIFLIFVWIDRKIEVLCSIIIKIYQLIGKSKFQEIINIIKNYQSKIREIKFIQHSKKSMGKDMQKQNEEEEIKDKIAISIFSAANLKKEEYEVLETNDNQKTQYQISTMSFQSWLNKFTLLIVTYLCIFGCIAWQLANLTTQMSQFKSVLEYKIEISTISHQILQQMLVYYQNSYIKSPEFAQNKDYIDIKIKEYQQFASLGNYFNLNYVVAKNITPAFNPFFQQCQKTLSDGACSMSIPILSTNPLLKILNCSEIQRGILTQGTMQAIQIVRRKMMELKQVPIQQLFKSETVDGVIKIPYQEIFYISNAIIEVLHNLESDYSEGMKMFEASKSDKARLTLILMMICIIPIMILIGIFLIRIQRRVQVVLGYFLIIPRGIINQMKICKFISSNKILDMIDWM